MIIDEKSFYNVAELITVFHEYARRALSINNKLFLDNEELEKALSTKEKTLDDKLCNIYLNARILERRGLSDEKLARIAELEKASMKYCGSGLSPINLKANEIEITRRKENKKIEDLEIEIPFYLCPDFNWQSFEGPITNDVIEELKVLISFLHKSPITINNQETIYKNILYALYKGASLSIDEMASVITSGESSVKK